MFGGTWTVTGRHTLVCSIAKGLGGSSARLTPDSAKLLKRQDTHNLASSFTTCDRKLDLIVFAEELLLIEIKLNHETNRQCPLTRAEIIACMLKPLVRIPLADHSKSRRSCFFSVVSTWGTYSAPCCTAYIFALYRSGKRRFLMSELLCTRNRYYSTSTVSCPMTSDKNINSG